MFYELSNRIFRMPLWAHSLLAAGSFGLFQTIKPILDQSYVASQHPVDFATGQTRFDAEAVKGYYAHMIEQDTLDVYWTTQFIDLGFIAAVILMGLFLATLSGRFARDGSLARRMSRWAGIALVCGGLCDLIENLISFVMLNNPVGFASWISTFYSGFAVTKFAFIATGLVLFLCSLLTVLIGRALSRPKIG